jgi:hypothetical protein
VWDLPRPTQASGASFTWLWWEYAAPVVTPGCVAPAHPALARAERQQPADVLSDPQWPNTWPFDEHDFRRRDEREDSDFYRCPAYTTHVDDAAIAALRDFYAGLDAFRESAGSDVLDLASSWISHYPKHLSAAQVSRISGVGMHGEELARNLQLGSFVVRDLNQSARLPYADDSMDLVTCAVSIDYFTAPLAILREVCRVLRVGGECHLSFSNRCFPTKVVGVWLSTNDAGHVWIVGSYFHFAGGFTSPCVHDISAGPGLDPMYVVSATKCAKASR